MTFFLENRQITWEKSFLESFPPRDQEIFIALQQRVNGYLATPPVLPKLAAEKIWDLVPGVAADASMTFYVVNKLVTPIIDQLLKLIAEDGPLPAPHIAEEEKIAERTITNGTHSAYESIFSIKVSPPPDRTARSVNGSAQAIAPLPPSSAAALREILSRPKNPAAKSYIHRNIEAEIPRLRRYARALTKDAVAADELVQDCLVLGLANQHLWKEGTDLRAWLFTVLHNKHVNRVRRAMRGGTAIELNENEALLACTPDQDKRLELRDLDRALAKLSEEQRAPILLVGLEGMRYEDVAETISVPVGTVRSRLSRGRDKLERLTEHNLNSEDGKEKAQEPALKGNALWRGRQNKNIFWSDPETQDIYFGDHQVKLAPRSKKLMAAFIASAGEVINRDQLRRALGWQDFQQISPYVSTLRKELTLDLATIGRSFKESVIKTVGHKGWRLTNSPMRKAAHLRKAPKEFFFSGFSFTGNGEDGVYFHHNKLLLAPAKRKILVALLKALGAPLPLSALRQAVYGSAPGDKSYVLWKHISGLRKQLEKLGFGNEFIETIKSGEHRGEYRIAVENIPAPGRSAEIIPLAGFRDRRLTASAEAPKLARA